MDQDKITGFINDYLKNLQNLKVADESIQQIRNQIKIIRIKSKGILIIPGKVCKNIYIIN